MERESPAPTRMNLLSRRAQIKLAAEGAQLLRGKREALLKELLKRARELRTLRKELHRRGRAAAATLAIARALRGTPEIESVALAGRREIDVTVRREKVWGIELADVEHSGLVRAREERPMGRLDVSSHILEAAELNERLLEQLVICAPVEANLQRLGEEVRKVGRRINALEEHLLPRLREDVRHISRALDEREREDVFRLKRYKKRKAAAQTAAAHEG